MAAFCKCVHYPILAQVSMNDICNIYDRGKSVDSLFQKALLRLRVLLFVLLCSFSASAKELYLNDSLLKIVNTIPERYQDTFYYNLGSYYYGMYNHVHMQYATDCYLRAMKIAQKYENTVMINQCYFGLGAVYDATNNLTWATRYYKLYYDTEEKSGDAKRIFRAAYNMAVVYAKAKDSSNTNLYATVMYDKLMQIGDSSLRVKGYVLLANLYYRINRKSDFITCYNQLPQGIVFRDEDLAYGRLYAEAKSYYYRLLDKDKDAISPLLSELAVTRDSIPLLEMIIANYERNEDYKSTYQYRKILDAVNSRATSNAIFKSIEYELLQAENEMQLKNNQLLQAKQKTLSNRNKLLYLVATILAISLAFAIYVERKYRKQNQLLLNTNDQIVSKNQDIEVLLKEVHHRVKNNLQIISSLIELQQIKPDTNTLVWTKEIQNKIMTIALAHQTLYEQQHYTSVSLQSYFEKMLETALRSLSIGDDSIRYNIRMNNLELKLDTLIPLALIVNELITNTMKYVVPFQSNCTIDLTCEDANGNYIFTYKDNGPGLPPHINLMKTGSLGLRLIRRLAAQIGAKVEVENKRGLLYTFNIDIK